MKSKCLLERKDEETVIKAEKKGKSRKWERKKTKEREKK